MNCRNLRRIASNLLSPARRLACISGRHAHKGRSELTRKDALLRVPDQVTRGSLPFGEALWQQDEGALVLGEADCVGEATRPGQRRRFREAGGKFGDGVGVGVDEEQVGGGAARSSRRVFSTR